MKTFVNQIYQIVHQYPFGRRFCRVHPFIHAGRQPTLRHLADFYKKMRACGFVIKIRAIAIQDSEWGNMATYVIGDVHGCYDELRTLLDKINYNVDSDALWFVGDLVNRGPKSLKTLRFLKVLPNVKIVLGNHDLAALAYAYGQRKPHISASLQKLMRSDDRDELLSFLRAQKLFHYDADLGFAMVHAGVHPSWSLKQTLKYAAEVEEALHGNQFMDYLNIMFGNKPNNWDDALTGAPRLRLITNILTRMRYCSSEGELDLQLKSNPSKQLKSKYLPWFDIENRRTLKHRIIFGHWSTLGLVQRRNIHAIDTGCLWGGRLTALRIDTEIVEIIQVNSRQPAYKQP